MKKPVLIVGTIIVIIAASLLAVGYWLNQPRQLDTSWIADVNNFLENAKPYPSTPTDGAFLLALYRLTLYDNGTDLIVNYTSYKTEFVLYLESLINQASEQPDSLISYDFVWNNLTKTDRVVVLQYRRNTDSPRRVDSAFFILDEKLNAGLNGTIVLQRNEGKPEWSTWVITK